MAFSSVTTTVTNPDGSSTLDQSVSVTWSVHLVDSSPGPNSVDLNDSGTYSFNLHREHSANVDSYTVHSSANGVFDDHRISTQPTLPPEGGTGTHSFDHHDQGSAGSSCDASGSDTTNPDNTHTLTETDDDSSHGTDNYSYTDHDTSANPNGYSTYSHDITHTQSGLAQFDDSSSGQGTIGPNGIYVGQGDSHVFHSGHYDFSNSEVSSTADSVAASTVDSSDSGHDTYSNTFNDDITYAATGSTSDSRDHDNEYTHHVDSEAENTYTVSTAFNDPSSNTSQTMVDEYEVGNQGNEDLTKSDHGHDTLLGGIGGGLDTGNEDYHITDNTGHTFSNTATHDLHRVETDLAGTVTTTIWHDHEVDSGTDSSTHDFEDQENVASDGTRTDGRTHHDTTDNNDSADIQETNHIEVSDTTGPETMTSTDDSSTSNLHTDHLVLGDDGADTLTGGTAPASDVGQDDRHEHHEGSDDFTKTQDHNSHGASVETDINGTVSQTVLSQSHSLNSGTDSFVTDKTDHESVSANGAAIAQHQHHDSLEEDLDYDDSSTTGSTYAGPTDPNTTLTKSETSTGGDHGHDHISESDDGQDTVSSGLGASSDTGDDDFHFDDSGHESFNDSENLNSTTITVDPNTGVTTTVTELLDDSDDGTDDYSDDIEDDETLSGSGATDDVTHDDSLDGTGDYSAHDTFGESVQGSATPGGTADFGITLTISDQGNDNFDETDAGDDSIAGGSDSGNDEIHDTDQGHDQFDVTIDEHSSASATDPVTNVATTSNLTLHEHDTGSDDYDLDGDDHETLAGGSHSDDVQHDDTLGEHVDYDLDETLFNSVLGTTAPGVQTDNHDTYTLSDQGGDDLTLTDNGENLPNGTGDDDFHEIDHGHDQFHETDTPYSSVITTDENGVVTTLTDDAHVTNDGTDQYDLDDEDDQTFAASSETDDITHNDQFDETVDYDVHDTLFQSIVGPTAPGELTNLTDTFTIHDQGEDHQTDDDHGEDDFTPGQNGLPVDTGDEHDHVHDAGHDQFEVTDDFHSNVTTNQNGLATSLDVTYSADNHGTDTFDDDQTDDGTFALGVTATDDRTHNDSLGEDLFYDESETTASSTVGPTAPGVVTDLHDTVSSSSQGEDDITETDQGANDVLAGQSPTGNDHFHETDDGHDHFTDSNDENGSVTVADNDGNITTVSADLHDSDGGDETYDDDVHDDDTVGGEDDVTYSDHIDAHFTFHANDNSTVSFAGTTAPGVTVTESDQSSVHRDGDDHEIINDIGDDVTVGGVDTGNEDLEEHDIVDEQFSDTDILDSDVTTTASNGLITTRSLHLHDSGSGTDSFDDDQSDDVTIGSGGVQSDQETHDNSYYADVNYDDHDSVTETTNGPTAPGELTNLTRTVTLNTTGHDHETQSDIGDHTLAGSGTENFSDSDDGNEAFDQLVIESGSVAETAPDGTVVTETVDFNDHDSGTDTYNDGTGDMSVLGSSDDVTYHDHVEEADDYNHHDTIISTVTSPNSSGNSFTLTDTRTTDKQGHEDLIQDDHGNDTLIGGVGTGDSYIDQSDNGSETFGVQDDLTSSATVTSPDGLTTTVTVTSHTNDTGGDTYDDDVSDDDAFSDDVSQTDSSHHHHHVETTLNFDDSQTVTTEVNGPTAPNVVTHSTVTNTTGGSGTDQIITTDNGDDTLAGGSDSGDEHFHESDAGNGTFFDSSDTAFAQTTTGTDGTITTVSVTLHTDDNGSEAFDDGLDTDDTLGAAASEDYTLHDHLDGNRSSNVNETANVTIVGPTADGGTRNVTDIYTFQGTGTDTFHSDDNAQESGAGSAATGTDFVDTGDNGSDSFSGTETVTSVVTTPDANSGTTTVTTTLSEADSGGDTFGKSDSDAGTLANDSVSDSENVTENDGSTDTINWTYTQTTSSGSSQTASETAPPQSGTETVGQTLSTATVNGVPTTTTTQTVTGTPPTADPGDFIDGMTRALFVETHQVPLLNQISNAKKQQAANPDPAFQIYIQGVLNEKLAALAVVQSKLGIEQRVADPVASMDVGQKFIAALQAAYDQDLFTGAVKAQVEELLQPENAAIAAAQFAAVTGLFALAQWTPVGWAADGLALAFMVGGGGQAAADLYGIYLDLDSATTQAELDQAAQSVANKLTSATAEATLGLLIKGVRHFKKHYRIEVNPRAASGATLGSNGGNLGGVVKIVKKAADATASKGLPNRGSARWDQLQSLRNRLRNLGPGNTSVRGTNKSLARVNSDEADYLGKSFVGDGYIVNSAGMYISKDGTKLYRPPTLKPGSPFSKTGKQANFVTREFDQLTGKWRHVSNGHIDVE
jgi:hypothetical protein